MIGILIYILFFLIPIISTILFVVSLRRYFPAKKKNKEVPGTFSDEEIMKRRKMLIVVSVIFGVVEVIFIGLLALLFIGIAYM